MCGEKEAKKRKLKGKGEGKCSNSNEGRLFQAPRLLGKAPFEKTSARKVWRLGRDEVPSFLQFPHVLCSRSISSFCAVSTSESLEEVTMRDEEETVK